MAYLNGPFPFNNFIFKVTLSSPATAEFFRRAHSSGLGGDSVAAVQPCVTMPPQEGVRTLVVRLSNPAALDLNNTNRVQNEVAAMQLTRESLTRRYGEEYGKLVPMVFAWKAVDEKMLSGEVEMNETGFGWTMMEYMAGTEMDVCLETFDRDEKRAAIGEVAKIFAAIQAAQVPTAVDRHGGLTVDQSGDVVSGQGTMLDGGPWTTYDEFLKAKMKNPLHDADTSSVVQGWKEGGLRDRIENFVQNKLSKVLREAGVELSKLVLLHVDFSELCPLPECPQRQYFMALAACLFSLANLMFPRGQLSIICCTIKSKSGSLRCSTSTGLQSVIPLRNFAPLYTMSMVGFTLLTNQS